MSQAAAKIEPPSAPLAADSLADGMLIMLVLTVIQRGAGFLRGILLCRWLAPEELGRWDLAWGFFCLAAPLAVLGLPGSFGRHVETFRQGGQLRSFLSSTAWACTGLAVIAALGLIAFPEAVSWYLFNSTAHASLAVELAVGLLAVIAFNFLIELLSALRQVRAVSLMQFANGILFTGIATLTVGFTGGGTSAIAAAYVAACGLTSVVAIAWLGDQLGELPEDRADLKQTDLWAKLAPFAAAVWLTNVVANLFDVADRQMIVHCSGLSEIDAQAMIGQYASSRAIPQLLVQLGGMAGSLLLPYLAHDWEAGRREEVSEKTNFALKLLGLVLFGGGTMILLAGPLVFGILFNGKYAEGEAILPLTLVYCTWLGMCQIAHYYLWCAERSWLSAVTLAVGVALNVALNLVLLPLLGLSGVVLATAAGNGAALAVSLALGIWLGLKVHRGTWVICLLPLTLAGGWLLAVPALIAVLIAIVRTEWILAPAEKDQLWTLAGAQIDRVTRLFART
jgi:O-antigen/teichoic acid export membrane protein